MRSNCRQNPKDKPVALVLNSKGLGVIRGLGREAIPVVALDPDPLAVGLYSRYAKGMVCPDPLISEEAFVEFLVDLGKRFNNKGVLFPTADPYVVAVVRAREQLEKYYKIPFPEWRIIREIVDKENQYKKMMKAGIPIPMTFFPKGINDIKTMGKDITYPVILKPAYSHSFVTKYGIKAIKVRSYAELLIQYKKYTLAGHKMLIQQIIGGGAERIYEFCSYTDKYGEAIATFTTRKLEQYPADFGTGTLVESSYEPTIIEFGKRVLKAFDYCGISHIEFKQDPATGQFKVIELNPRTTISNSLSTECGVNFPYIAYQDMLGKKITRVFPSYNTRWIFPERRLFYQRKINFIRQKGSPSSQKKKSIYAIFSFNDPIPELVYLYALFSRRVKKWLKRAWKSKQDVPL